jgi:hypothetical protein
MLLKQDLNSRILTKSILLFYSANVLAYSLHELAHAAVAHFLHVPATLFHLYADIDDSLASESDRILIALAGPVFSLVVGALCSLFYRKSSSQTARLFLLYTATLSISIFFGNLLSASRIGDFSKVTRLLQFSNSLRYAISAAGLLALIVTMLIAGRKLLNIVAFEGSQKRLVILHLIVSPLFVGTGLVVITYHPLPTPMIAGIISSSIFWIFSVLGVVTGKITALESSSTRLSVIDVALFLFSILVVRILVTGISFGY